MNNVTMGGMNAMGGPVGGGGMPMGMNNGAAAARPPMVGNADQRMQLNTYIYEYFLRNEMYDCARSLLNSDGINLNLLKDSPGRRRENGAGDEGGDGESKDDVDSKRPSDLPEPSVPKDCPESCFLYEWWCLFWDMFNAQRGKGEGRNVLQYVHHTQAQSRMRQENQQQMLRGLRNGNMMQAGQYEQMMMRQNQQANGMPLNPNELRQKAIQNNRNTTPQQQMMLAQQQKQQAMQRDPSDGSNQQRPQSPGSADAPSPSKRPRLDGTPGFNPQQMPNGRQVAGMPQQVGDTGPSNALQAAHMQLTNGIEQNNLTAQQFQNIPGGPNASAQARLGAYQANMAQQQAQQAGQMGAVKPMPNQGGPQNQGSPMMTQGQDGGAIANYYNPGEMGPNGIRGGPGGQPGGSGGNHALQDYQMQLMLLEQQNKKRLMMARQEQDNMMPRPDGQGGPGGANGQPFQGTSPQGGPRNSPNPGDQMKRGTPHMNNAGMPSPLPEGQSRGSPSSGMNFNLPGGPMDPSMNPQFYNKMNGMDPNMVAGMGPNGMRPPSSHPGGAFNQMTPQQMAMARQQQQQAQQQAVQNQWQNGPNGQMIQQPGAQGPPQQNMGTPQQRNMPPPSVPAANAATNGRATSSPQQNPAPPTPSQTNKKALNKKATTESKDSKAKRAAKKGSNAINAGATPSADADAAAATPTPATPITPHPPSGGFKGQNGAVQPVANGQVPASNTNAGAMSQQQDQVNFMDNNAFDFPGPNTMVFADANNGNLDVLQDFDFDSFLNHDDSVGDSFNFDMMQTLDGNEIGAE